MTVAIEFSLFFNFKIFQKVMRKTNNNNNTINTNIKKEKFQFTKENRKIQ